MAGNARHPPSGQTGRNQPLPSRHDFHDLERGVPVVADDHSFPSSRVDQMRAPTTRMLWSGRTQQRLQCRLLFEHGQVDGQQLDAAIQPIRFQLRFVHTRYIPMR